MADEKGESPVKALSTDEIDQKKVPGVKRRIPEWLSGGILFVLFPALFVVFSGVLGFGFMLLQGASFAQIWDLLREQLIGAYEVALAFVIAFPAVLIPFGVSSKLSYSFYARPSLTPQDRVSHLISDTNDGLEHWGSWSLGIAIFFGIRLTLWNKEPIAWIVLMLLTVVASSIVIRWGIRDGHREAIAERLREERHKWDPEETNPKVFVIKRDTVPVSVDLFERITLACYERKITVLQYTDFKWPTYRHVSGINTSHVFKDPNPAAVAAADAVLWMDIGTQTNHITYELETAKGRNMAIIHLKYDQENSDELIVQTDSGVRKPISVRDVPEYVGDLFQKIFERQTA